MSSIARLSVANTLTPINTAPGAPQSTALNLGWCILDRVELRIPPGHFGLTGWSLQVNGVGLIPWQQPGEFIIGDDDHLALAIDIELDTGLTIVTYNQDTLYPHTHYARFIYTPISELATPVPAVSAIPIG